MPEQIRSVHKGRPYRAYSSFGFYPRLPSGVSKRDASSTLFTFLHFAYGKKIKMRRRGRLRPQEFLIFNFSEIGKILLKDARKGKK